MRVLSFMFCAVLLMGASAAWAYDEIQVTEGGTIAGKVTMVGAKPRPKGFNLITFPDPVYCGRISTGTGWRILHEFTLAQDGGLQDAVVLLTDATKGKPFKFEPPTIEARDCRFLPFVSVVKDRAEVNVVNLDPVFHDIQAYETSLLGPRVLFNTPLPMNPHHKRNVGADSHEHLGWSADGGSHSYDERPPDICHAMRIPCLYGKLGVRRSNNPYFAITQADGTFSLSDVPPGDYTLVAWHPGVGTMTERKVTVPAKQMVKADFVFESPQGRRSAHEIEENPHFGLGSLGKSIDIKPTLELQVP